MNAPSSPANLPLANPPPEKSESDPARPFRRAVLSGMAVILPPLLTIVIFVWIWGTLDAYVLTYVEAGVRRVIVYQYQDEIRSLDPAGPRPDVMEIDGRSFHKVVDNDYVPEPMYQHVKKYLAGEELPRSAQRVVELYVQSRYLKPQVVIPIFVCVVILIAYLLGKLMAARIGGFVWGYFERIVRRLPLVRNVYSSVKQVTDFMFSKSELSFSRVVAVEYPRLGIWSVGFVTGEGLIDVASAGGEPVLSVLLPTSPMPMTGYVMMFRKSEVLDLKLTIEEALEYIVSCGVVVAPHQWQTAENLARLRGELPGSFSETEPK
jgi:uncharacterized membrane protein